MDEAPAPPGSCDASRSGKATGVGERPGSPVRGRARPGGPGPEGRRYVYRKGPRPDRTRR